MACCKTNEHFLHLFYARTAVKHHFFFKSAFLLLLLLSSQSFPFLIIKWLFSTQKCYLDYFQPFSYFYYISFIQMHQCSFREQFTRLLSVWVWSYPAECHNLKPLDSEIYWKYSDLSSDLSWYCHDIKFCCHALTFSTKKVIMIKGWCQVGDISFW